jgi:hypothetical protein
MHTAFPRRSWVVAATASLVLLAAACGGGATKTAAPVSTTTVAPTPTTASAAAFRVYQQCLAAHGVVRSPTTVAGQPTTTVAQATADAARQACAALRPAGGFGGPGGGGGGGGFNGPQSAAYRTCLQQHGVTLPAPGQGTSAPPSSIDRNNPAFQAAAQACASLRPARGTTTTTA